MLTKIQMFLPRMSHIRLLVGQCSVQCSVVALLFVYGCPEIEKATG